MINRYVALDIETTGLNPAVDRIIEVGMARVENDCITEKYSTLVYPGISISERITGLTGIHNDDLIGKPRIDRKSTRLNSSHYQQSRMPSSA